MLKLVLNSRGQAPFGNVLSVYAQQTCFVPPNLHILRTPPPSLTSVLFFTPPLAFHHCLPKMAVCLQLAGLWLTETNK